MASRTVAYWPMDVVGGGQCGLAAPGGREDESLAGLRYAVVLGVQPGCGPLKSLALQYVQELIGNCFASAAAQSWDVFHQEKVWWVSFDDSVEVQEQGAAGIRAFCSFQVGKGLAGWAGGVKDSVLGFDVQSGAEFVDVQTGDVVGNGPAWSIVGFVGFFAAFRRLCRRLRQCQRPRDRGSGRRRRRKSRWL